MTKLTLKGSNYEGNFDAVKTSSEHTANGCQVSYDVTTYYWEGTGEIKNLKTGEEVRFNLCACSGEFGKDINLETSILRVDGTMCPPYWGRPKISNRSKFIDLELKAMFEHAKEVSETENVPRICPDSYTIETLIEEGVLADKQGQVNLAFSE